MTPAVVPKSEAGYALVAAVAAILFFAIVALGVLALTQRAVVAGSAEVEAARASAAADAGMALALQGLLSAAPGDGFPIGDRHNPSRFDGADLDIVITDERGKVPVNLLDEKQLTALLEIVGLNGEPLAIARDSFLDWIDDDDAARADGAEVDYYRLKGLRPRNAGLLTLGELARIRGFTPTIAEKIRTVATTDFGNGGFDARFASPTAIRIMYPDGDAAVAEIVRARESQGQTTAFSFGDRPSLVGRPVTITVKATYASGTVAERSCVVELTGAARRPYVIRHCD